MMTQVERAKQFLPFDSLKGLQEALRDREERYLREERREVVCEAAEQLERVMRRLSVGDTVEIVYYRNFHTVRRTGTVTRFSPEIRCLFIDGSRIGFEDVYSLRVTDHARSRTGGVTL